MHLGIYLGIAVTIHVDDVTLTEQSQEAHTDEKFVRNNAPAVIGWAPLMGYE